jgi:hypothetical protein
LPYLLTVYPDFRGYPRPARFQINSAIGGPEPSDRPSMLLPSEAGTSPPTGRALEQRRPPHSGTPAAGRDDHRSIGAGAHNSK